MTRPQIAALPRKENAVVVIAAGSIEQHGPHLPVGVDAMLAETMLDAALARMPLNVPVYVGPPITYGTSSEHTGFPGTISLSSRTLHRLVFALARQVHALGFRTLALFNAHGGNSAVFIATLREIQSALGMNAVMLRPAVPPDLSPQERAFGFHAGQIETAWMLAIAPELVRMKRAVCEYPVCVDDSGELRPENASATRAWHTSDLSRSGVIGDATAATEADGRHWFEAAVASLVHQLTQLAAEVARQSSR